MGIVRIDPEVMVWCLPVAESMDALGFELAVSVAGSLQIHRAIIPQMEALLENVWTTQDVPPLLGHLECMSVGLHCLMRFLDICLRAADGRVRKCRDERRRARQARQEVGQ
jgi:hypothetical protein